MSIDLHNGDCLEIMRSMEDCSVDAVVTDPPYHLKQMTKRFSKPDAKPCGYGKDGSFRRLSKGFMGQSWDGGDIAFKPEVWAECLRLLKPGGHLLAFGGTRTYHRLACAIEDAGFEIRDTIMWLYGSGFPKSLDVSKAVAQNVLEFGTGGINVDACRIDLNGDYKCKANGRPSQTGLGDNYDPSKANLPDTVGRWPANVVHDGSEEVLALFPETKSGAVLHKHHKGQKTDAIYGAFKENISEREWLDNGGSAARFFYCAKASKKERGNSKHPTVKPLKLMEYLCRLVTPPKGIILDPFAGSGTTGIAASHGGFNAILIEADENYFKDIQKRVNEQISGLEMFLNESSINN